MATNITRRNLWSRYYRCSNHLRLHSSNVRYCNHSAAISRPDKGARPSVYDCAFVESKWYEWWKNSGLFQLPSTSSKRPFSICLPPPNVTGDLHVGHALTVAIEDVILRWHKMNGANCVWIPGFDHAGIATQVVVEKQLMRERGLRRIDMNREDFVNECFRWKEAKTGIIQKQLERLGASLDWSRMYYTMDEKFSTAVTEAFLLLRQRGFVFRGERLVNWCPFLRSTLSDIEVEKMTFNFENEREAKIRLPGRTDPVIIGRLFYVKYPVVDQHNDEFLTVATTRPETIFADVALAVHPEDSRYGKYVGKFVRNPMLENANPILVIADDKVDPSFGTGVLKVTPAHDWTDYEIGVKHRLPLNIQCLSEDGKLNELCGPDSVGQDRFDAREMVAKLLTNRGLLVDVKHQSQVTLPLCGRTGDVVEPILKQQWFIDCRHMASEALRAVEEGRLKITPKFHEAQWRHWLGLTNDWCISRQLWWGHRIPAYQLKQTGSWYCGKNVTDVINMAQRDHPSVAITSEDLKQDEDVLDTWFSSSLVPLVASGWPKETSELYPLALMETGHDILSFWVTRMVMMGLELTNRLPFDEILLHGLVFDKNGRKMSKSLGNVVDPLDIIDGVELDSLKRRLDISSLPETEIAIAKDAMEKEFPQGVLPCGADALRFILLRQSDSTPQLNLDVKLMLSGRKFCNKLWQAFNFMDTSWKVAAEHGWTCEGCFERLNKGFQNLPIVEQWILSRLSSAVDVINRSFNYHGSQIATNELYSFAWFDLCDIYLEWSKFFLQPKDDVENEVEERKRIIGDILYLVADVYIRCLAPFMPFLAEELYGRLLDIRRTYGSEKGEQLEMVSVHSCQFPRIDQLPYANKELEKQMSMSRNIIEATRSVRIEFGLPVRQQLSCVYFGSQDYLTTAKTFESFLALVGKITTNNESDYRPLNASTSDLNLGHIWKSVDENMFLAVKVEQMDHERVIQRLTVQIEKLKKRKRDYETTRQKAQGILKGEIGSWRSRKPRLIEKEVNTLNEKIISVDTEIDKLEKVYANFHRS